MRENVGHIDSLSSRQLVIMFMANATRITSFCAARPFVQFRMVHRQKFTIAFWCVTCRHIVDLQLAPWITAEHRRFQYRIETPVTPSTRPGQSQTCVCACRSKRENESESSPSLWSSSMHARRFFVGGILSTMLKIKKGNVSFQLDSCSHIIYTQATIAMIMTIT
jgi:hypothetical protein